MYSKTIFVVFILISSTLAGILPKSRRPLSHGHRNSFVLGQIALRDPSLEMDNFALRKSVYHSEDTSELFGKDGIIYLSDPMIKNNLLNKVAEQIAAQYLRLRVTGDQESRSLEEPSPDYRRAEGEKPKLVYDFNELVV